MIKGALKLAEKIEIEINKTSSGELRNLLCNANIMIRALTTVYVMPEKTLITKWKHINKCSTRLRHILCSDIECLKFIEDIDMILFFKQRNAGKKTWNEFIELRGY